MRRQTGVKIKAILFDLDGVLVDATEWHYEALNRALGLFGYNIARYEHDLLSYATAALQTVPGLRLIGTAREKASVLSFVLAGHDPVAVGKALNQEGIAVRAGHHCSQPSLRRFGVEATVRPSLAFYNTVGEIDRLGIPRVL